MVSRVTTNVVSQEPGAELARAVVVCHEGPWLEPEIRRLSGWYRYSLHVAEGEDVWSYNCGHLHARPSSARKCAARTLQSWSEWEGVERIREGAWDWSMVRSLRTNGAYTTIMQRVSILDAPDIVDELPGPVGPIKKTRPSAVQKFLIAD